MKTKMCHKCKYNQNITEFQKDKTTKDGYNVWCKKCHKKTLKIWRRNNSDKIKLQGEKYINNNRWRKHYTTAEQRCNNSKNDSYKSYGKKGIEMSMVSNDFKYLWFRDKAYLMEKPSIDRKNNKGNYTLENCRFIELTKNIKRKRG